MIKPCIAEALKRCHRWGWLLGTALILVSMPLAAKANPKILTIGADLWCPVNCAIDAPQAGIGIDLAKAVFEPLGYQVEYKIMPWSRALEEVRAGKLDAVVGANVQDEPALVFPKHALLQMTDDFYMRANDAKEGMTLESLRSKRIGIIHDYGYGKEITQLIDSMRSTPAAIQETGGEDALEQNIRKLLAGRIDAIIESAAVMDYKLQQMEEERIVYMGGVAQGPVYLAFSPALPESKEYKRIYDERVTELAAQKKLGEVYAPYGLSPPEMP